MFRARAYARGGDQTDHQEKNEASSEKCCAPRDENTLSAIPTSARSGIFRPEHLCNLFFFLSFFVVVA